MRLLTVLLLSMPLLACGPEPFYDDNIGVEGIATEPGSLAGQWAFHLRYIDVAYVPLLAREVESGGDQYFLVDRAWDAASASYSESWTFCIDDNMETAGLRMTTPDATRDSVVLLDTAPTLEHASGEYGARDAVQLWALRDLPDLFNTPVPTPDNYQEAPQRDWIYDADGDGNLGCTMLLNGFLEGEDYYISRKINHFRGVVATPDQIFGLQSHSSSWSVLEATVLFAVHTGEIPSDDGWQHPDPKRNWFEQIRMADDASCDDVRRARESEQLSKLRPF